MSDDTATPEADPTLELLLEAARRANWDAKHGPRHRRSGRYLVRSPFDPERESVQGIDAALTGSVERRSAR